MCRVEVWDSMVYFVCNVVLYYVMLYLYGIGFVRLVGSDCDWVVWVIRLFLNGWMGGWALNLGKWMGEGRDGMGWDGMMGYIVCCMLYAVCCMMYAM